MKPTRKQTGQYAPKDALKLLRDPEIQCEAISPYSNPRGWRPKNTTCARNGLPLHEELRDELAAFEIQWWVERVVALDPKAFAEAVAPEIRLAVKQVPKKTTRDFSNSGCGGIDPLSDEAIDLTPPVPDPDAETRPIVVAGAKMRALVNVFALVLTRTCDHLLPREATAYREGKADPVARTVMPIAKVIGGGYRYFVSMDIKNCFPSLPWQGIEAALLDLGYPAEFVQMIMVLVRAPLDRWERGQSRARGQRGRWVEIPNDRGAQAGLPISSILLNILLRPLDLHIKREYRGRVTYERYSDNLYFVAWSRDHLAGAVRYAKRWIEGHGLRLKGISPGQSPHTLIQDVRSQRVEVLGIEIDHEGRTYVTEKQVQQKLTEIQFFTNRLQFAPEYVGAISRYQRVRGSRRNPGVDLKDSEDIAAMIRSTQRWIGSFNSIQARAFEDQIRSERGSVRQILGFSDGPIYVAALGAVDARGAEAVIGDDPTGRLDRESIENLIQGDLALGIEDEGSEPVAYGDMLEAEVAIGTVDRDLPWMRSLADAEGALGRSSPQRSSQADEPAVPCSCPRRGPGHRDAGPCSESASLVQGESLDEGAVRVRVRSGDPGGEEGSDCAFGDGEAQLSRLHSARPRGRNGSCPVTGIAGSAGAGTGVPSASTRPLLEKRREIVIASRYFRRGKYTAVGLERVRNFGDGDLDADRTIEVTESGRHQHAAGLRVILDEVREAARAGEGLVIVRLEDPWLAKALVQHDRAIRAIDTGQLVADLHQEAERLGVLVLVAGPVPVPDPVDTALARYAQQRAVETARRKHRACA